ncbi:MAG TPA: hypothetical protein VHX87_04800 [Galbitalea sp.]|nr:hypothetical protein [Galbitalea sp.]
MAVVLILVVVVVVLSVRAAVPTTFTAKGTFDLINTADGGACDPPDGYTDLSAGAQVIISTGGKTVAIGELSEGTKLEGGLTCHYTFAVRGVPLGHKFYGVEITHRGVVQESATDMEDGKVALSIGS